ncbi:hypothetical protein G6F35_017802 [Rhizopus arrhizus]|nr:hypothetical protein G6F35_017802 [Rhizopus arrhizus]
MTSVENRARLVLGNWKMHGNLAENAALLTELRAADAASHCDIGICVPFPYLAQAGSALTGSSVSWGAQDNSAAAGRWPVTPSAACCTVKPMKSWPPRRKPRWPPA